MTKWSRAAEVSDPVGVHSRGGQDELGDVHTGRDRRGRCGGRIGEAGVTLDPRGGDVSGNPGRPDWAALYQEHRAAMHRVAATVLRETGLVDQAEDAVQKAMASLMKSSPAAVGNWEAVMVTAARWKALDRLRSAAVSLGPAGRRRA